MFKRKYLDSPESSVMRVAGIEKLEKQVQILGCLEESFGPENTPQDQTIWLLIGEGTN